MELTKNALAVLKKRYFKKDANGKSIEDATKMLRRVSKNIAGADKEKEKKEKRPPYSLGICPLYHHLNLPHLVYCSCLEPVLIIKAEIVNFKKKIF